MPTYEYVCQQCEKPFEVHRTMVQHAEQGAPPCPQCGSPKVTRRFAALNVAVGSRSGGGAAPSCDAGGGCCCN
jgi:putative FmdB family regulatory protein